VAGGLELALWCDLRVVEEDAVLGVFCRRWGVPLIDGGTVRLPRLIGLSRALDLILTGRPVGAAEALDIGLANRVVRAERTARRRRAGAAARRSPAGVLARRPALRARATRARTAAALQNELRHGVHVLSLEGFGGAQHFATGPAGTEHPTARRRPIGGNHARRCGS